MEKSPKKNDIDWNIQQEYIDNVCDDIDQRFLTMLSDRYEEYSGYNIEIKVNITKKELHHGLPSSKIITLHSSDTWEKIWN